MPHRATAKPLFTPEHAGELSARDREAIEFAKAQGYEVLPTPEALARYDAWLASEDPEFIAELDELDRRDDRMHRRG